MFILVGWLDCWVWFLDLLVMLLYCCLDLVFFGFAGLLVWVLCELIVFVVLVFAFCLLFGDLSFTG